MANLSQGPRPYHEKALQQLQDAISAQAAVTGDPIERRLRPVVDPEIHEDRFHPPHLKDGNDTLKTMIDGVKAIEVVHESQPAIQGLRGHILRSRYNRARNYAHYGTKRHATVLRVAEMISRSGEGKKKIEGSYLVLSPSARYVAKEPGAHEENGMGAIKDALELPDINNPGNTLSLRPTTLSEVRTTRRLERKAAASRKAFSEVSAIKRQHGVSRPLVPTPAPREFDAPPTRKVIKYPDRGESVSLSYKERRNRKKADHHAHMHHGHEGPIRKTVNTVGKKVAPAWFLSHHEKAEAKRETFKRIAEGKDRLSLGRYKNRRTMRAIERTKNFHADMEKLAQKQADRKEDKQRRAAERAQGIKWHHKLRAKFARSEQAPIPPEEHLDITNPHDDHE